MPDITLAVTISRTYLSLPALDVNDHVNYYLGPFSPGQVRYERQRAQSQYVDGEHTTSRRMTNVEEQLVIEVLAGAAGTAASANTNLTALINALKQADFTFAHSYEGQAFSWSCEADGIQVLWDGPRWVARQFQVTAALSRSPRPLAGSF